MIFCWCLSSLFHFPDQFRESLRLAHQIGYGPGRFGHGFGDLSAHSVTFENGVIDLLAGCGLFLAGCGDGVDLIRRGLCRGHNFLQGPAHFYYPATKWFSDGDVHSYFNPYDSPYEAFINYMNVLSDFEIEVDKKYGEAIRAVPA